MKKRVYQHPTMLIAKMHQTQMLCTSTSDSLNDVNSDVGLSLGGSFSGPARARHNNSMGWDSWDTWE